MKRLRLIQIILLACMVSMFMEYMVYGKSACTTGEGTLDATFGVDGKVVTMVTNIPGAQDIAKGVEVLSCGTIIVAGHTVFAAPVTADFSLVGYMQYGAIKDSFGPNGNGRVLTDISTLIDPDALVSDDRAYAMVLQKSGDECAAECALDCVAGDNSNCKLVLVGSSDALDIGGLISIALVRYSCQGIVDTSFGNGTGAVIVSVGVGVLSVAYAVALQDDGKIVVAGTAVNGSNQNMCIVRLNSDGSLDTSFANQGIALVDYSLLDSSYGASIAYAVKIQKNGKIVVAGVVGNNASKKHFAVARLTTDGSLDTRFGVQGKVVTDFSGNNMSNDEANALLLLDDCADECNDSGRIVAIGYNNQIELPLDQFNFALACYTDRGELDLRFGLNGTGLVTTMFSKNSLVNFAYAGVLQPDCDNKDKIIAVGFTGLGDLAIYFAVARYTCQGWLDTSFGNDGKVITDFPLLQDVALAATLQSNGDLIVAGVTKSLIPAASQFAVARYNICQSCCL